MILVGEWCAGKVIQTLQIILIKSSNFKMILNALVHVYGCNPEGESSKFQICNATIIVLAA